MCGVEMASGNEDLEIRGEDGKEKAKQQDHQGKNRIGEELGWLHRRELVENTPVMSSHRRRTDSGEDAGRLLAERD
jgi:hypothetical protein